MTSEAPRIAAHDPDTSAVVRLVEGASSSRDWRVGRATEPVRVLVGSGPDANWRIDAPGVQPTQFELHWDGRYLWAGAPAVGLLRVNGQPAHAWTKLDGRSRLEFGSASMVVEVSQPSVAPVPLVEVDAAQSDFADDDPMRTMMVDPNMLSKLDDAVPVAAPFVGSGDGAASDRAGETPDAQSGQDVVVKQSMHTELGSRFARPDDASEFAANFSLRERLRRFRITENQARIVAFGTLIGFLCLGMWLVRDRRATAERAAADETRIVAQQQEAQKTSAEEAAHRFATAEAERARAKKETDAFLDARSNRLTLVRAREEALALHENRDVDPSVISSAIASERRTVENEAAMLLTQNSFARAIVLYRQLAGAHPEDPTYRSIVRALESKLQCGKSGSAAGEPCH